MTDSISRRWILADDADARFVYSGSWFIDSYTTPGPLQATSDLNLGTAHATNTSASFSFSYEGGNATVWGGSSRPPSEGSVRCTLDGQAMQQEVAGQSFYREFWALCRGSTQVEGVHELKLDFAPNDGTYFWLDMVAYASPENPDLTGKYSMIEPSSPFVQFFGNGWKPAFSQNTTAERLTTLSGSVVSVKFFGISIQLRGILLANMSRTPATATFSIDGGPPTPFELPVYSDGYRGMDPGTGRWRVPFLTTPPIVNGGHTLDIVYRGNGATVPLSVDYFLVAHEGASVTPSTNIRTTTTEGSATNKPPKPISLAAIAGGIVGGALVIGLILVVLVVFLRRISRRKYSSVSQDSGPSMVPFVDDAARNLPPSRPSQQQGPTIQPFPYRRASSGPTATGSGRPVEYHSLHRLRNFDSAGDGPPQRNFGNMSFRSGTSSYGTPLPGYTSEVLEPER